MRTRALVVLPLALALSCGYSEEEWRAQLAKYEALDQQNKELQAELDKQQARVQELTAQLESMGVKLSSEGSEKEKLAKDVAQMKAALAEYQARAEMLERIKQRFELLRTKLKKLTELGLDVRIRNNRMVISLPGDVLFASGRDELRQDGEQILGQVAQVIQGDASLRSRQFQVAGHTDNQPLNRAADRFHDNWGLSLMRARQVLVFLVAPPEGEKPAKAAKAEPAAPKLDPKRWSASGYGSTDPVAANDTPEGKAKNRRVELILMPDVEEMLDLKSLL